MRQFLGRTIRHVKSRPRTIVVDKGRQFWCRGFKSWCRRQDVRPRFGAVGRRGSIALIERLIRTLKEEFIAGLIVPGLRSQFQRQLDSFVTRFNGFRPHSALDGRTPNEVYLRRKPANRKVRTEPRAKWPRGSPCAEPRARVIGKCGARLALHIRFHARHKQLPVMTLRKAA